MDTRTLQAYDADAAGFAKEWHEQAAPSDMHDLLRRYFRPGPTADVGCGAGRDVGWLVANDYDACGFDACEALLREARSRYPGLVFEAAALPGLETVAKGFYENVLCETVIMHLEPSAIGTATRNLLALLRPGGTLYLSWRVTDDTSQRDQAGRLYAAFEKQAVLDALDGGVTVLFDREDVSVSSGKRIHRLIVRQAEQSKQPA